MNNWISFTFMLVAIFIISSNVKATDKFLRGINDLPLMPGLQEDLGASIIFEKPNGRIIVALATGNESIKSVRDFYTKTLPQLGWDNIDGGVFQRSGERLTLTIHEENNTTSVRFSVRPRQ